MSLDEFSLINRFFKNLTPSAKGVICDIGDDAAIISVPSGFELAVSTDTLVDNIHFPSGTEPRSIGYKALAVNLSDMAAMGAEPRWATLSLTLPDQNEGWLAGFSNGFAELANQYNVSLVGGDMSHGPLSVTVQIMGVVAEGMAITRSGAKVGDSVFITGQLGCAALALWVLQGKYQITDVEDCLTRLNTPEPRIRVGQALTGIATAAIDISDGLAGDLEHLLTASSVSAEMQLENIPVCEKLVQLEDMDAYWQAAIGSGDDYELCFTAPASTAHQLEEITKSTGCSMTKIGDVVEGQGKAAWLLKDGSEYRLSFSAYRHF